MVDRSSSRAAISAASGLNNGVQLTASRQSALHEQFVNIRESGNRFRTHTHTLPYERWPCADHAHSQEMFSLTISFANWQSNGGGGGTHKPSSVLVFEKAERGRELANAAHARRSMSGRKAIRNAARVRQCVRARRILELNCVCVYVFDGEPVNEILQNETRAFACNACIVDALCSRPLTVNAINGV